MIDIRKLLFNYPKLKVGIENIKVSLKNLELNRVYHAGSSGLSDMPKSRKVSSPTESFALVNLQAEELFIARKEQLERDLAGYIEIVNLIDKSLSILTDDQRAYIAHRYFNGRRQVSVALLMNISVSSATRLEKQVMSAIKTCFNGGNMEFLVSTFDRIR